MPAGVAGARERVVDLVDAEVVELGEDGREVGRGRGARCATRSPAATPGSASTRGHAVARVLVERLIGHLEVQPGRDAVFHGADATAPRIGPAQELARAHREQRAVARPHPGLRTR